MAVGTGSLFFALIILFSDISPLQYSAATLTNQESKKQIQEVPPLPNTPTIPESFSIESEGGFSESKESSFFSSEESPLPVDLSSKTPLLSSENISQKRVLHVFHDFYCPYCKRNFLEVISPLRDSQLFSEQGIVIRFYAAPIQGENSLALFRAEKCAKQQEKQWEFINRLYTSSEQNMEIAREIASNLELNMDMFQECLDSEETNQKIMQDKAFLEDSGVTAIPAMIFLDEVYQGIYPPENIEKVIRNDLKITP